MKEIVEEYGTAVLAAAGGAAVIACMGYAFTDPDGAISLLLGKLVSLYL